MPRIGKEYDRLARDEQDASRKALQDAERDQQVQPGRDGGKRAGRAHRRGSSRQPGSRASNRVISHGGGQEADQLQSGVADIQPGELVWCLHRCRQ